MSNEKKTFGPEKAIASLVGGIAGMALFFGVAPSNVEVWQQIAAVAVPVLATLAVYFKSNSEK